MMQAIDEWIAAISALSIQGIANAAARLSAGDRNDPSIIAAKAIFLTHPRVRMVEALHAKQSWRSDSENEYLMQWNAQKGTPFCYDCADWHQPGEICSTTYDPTTGFSN